MEPDDTSPLSLARPSADAHSDDPAELRREIDELRDALVTMEIDLGRERGERVKFQSLAHQEKLRANAAFIARDRMAASLSYRLGHALTLPLRVARRATRRMVRRVVRSS